MQNKKKLSANLIVEYLRFSIFCPGLKKYPEMIIKRGMWNE